MGFLKNTLKGALVAKVATEARKPKNQAKAKSALSGLRSRFSGSKTATPAVRGRAAKTTTRATTVKGSAKKGTTRPR